MTTKVDVEMVRQPIDYITWRGIKWMCFCGNGFGKIRWTVCHQQIRSHYSCADISFGIWNCSSPSQHWHNQPLCPICAMMMYGWWWPWPSNATLPCNTGWCLWFYNSCQFSPVWRKLCCPSNRAQTYSTCATHTTLRSIVWPFFLWFLYYIHPSLVLSLSPLFSLLFIVSQIGPRQFLHGALKTPSQTLHWPIQLASLSTSVFWIYQTFSLSKMIICFPNLHCVCVCLFVCVCCCLPPYMSPWK